MPRVPTRSLQPSPFEGEPAQPCLPTVLAAREAERLRVARDLHDELGQHLLALRLELWRLAQADEAHEAQALRQRVRGLMPLVDGTMAAVRRIAADLRPPDLCESGLVSALQSLAQQVRARLSVNVEVHAQLGDLRENTVDEGVELAGYRIVQEALSNAVRHARASSVGIEVAREGQFLVVSVRDDGPGLRLISGSARRHLGLQGMRERAQACGGRLHVRNGLHGGCVVEARLPISFELGAGDGQGRPQEGLN